MIKTFHYKLKPTKAQQLAFSQWLGSCRFVYNLVLSHKIDLYKNYQITLSKGDAQKELTEIRNQYNWIGQVHSQTLQSVTDRLYLAYDAFFKRGSGFPKFAKKGFYSSFEFKQGVKPCPNTKKIKLPSIGKVKYHESRPIEGIIKKAVIKNEGNDWFISLSCEVEQPQPKEKNNNQVGVDVGLNHFAVLSNGEKIDNPRLYRKSENIIKLLSKSISRKKKGSNNKKKAIEQLRKEHLKIRNTRKDFLHKLSTRLINENQVIVLEDLKVKNMIKNPHLSKSIGDAGWSMFKTMLKYKAEWYGRELIVVPPHNTSKDCSECGWRKEEMVLSTREWVCEGCGAVHDRDINASKNILNRGHNVLAELGHNSDIAEETKVHEHDCFNMATQ